MNDIIKNANEFNALPNAGNAAASTVTPIFTGTITAAQVRDACPAALEELCKRVAAHFESTKKYFKKIENNDASIGKLLALIAETCDEGGFEACREKFYPELGRSRTFELKAIAAGRKSIAQIREETRKRVAKHRAGESVTAKVTDSQTTAPPAASSTTDVEGSAGEQKRYEVPHANGHGRYADRMAYYAATEPADSGAAHNTASAVYATPEDLSILENLRRKPAGSGTTENGPDVPGDLKIIKEYVGSDQHPKHGADGAHDVDDETESSATAPAKTPARPAELLDYWQIATAEERRAVLRYEGVIGLPGLLSGDQELLGDLFNRVVGQNVAIASKATTFAKNSTGRFHVLLRCAEQPEPSADDIRNMIDAGRAIVRDAAKRGIARANVVVAEAAKKIRGGVTPTS